MINHNFDPIETEFPKFRFSKMLRNMVFTLIILLILSVAAKVVEFDLARKSGDFRGLLGELEVSSSQLVGQSKGAVEGQVLAFQGLEELSARIDEQWLALKESVPQGNEVLMSELLEVEEVWARIHHNTLVITQNKSDILLVRDMAVTVNEALPPLQAEHSNLAEIYLDTEASAEQVSLVLRQSWFAERIGRNLDKVLRGGKGTDVAADKFYSDAIRFGKVLESMKTGNKVLGISKAKSKAALQSIKKSTDLYELIHSSIKDIFDRSPAISRANQAAVGIIDGSPLLLARLILLSEKYDEYEGRFNSIKLLSLACIIITSFLLLLLILLKLKLELRKYHKAILVQL